MFACIDMKAHNMKYTRLIDFLGICLVAISCAGCDSISNTAVVRTFDNPIKVLTMTPTTLSTDGPIPTNTVVLPAVTTTLVPRATQELWEPTAYPGIGVTVYYPEDWSISSWSEYPDTASAHFRGHDGHYHFYAKSGQSLEAVLEYYLNREDQLFGSDSTVEAFLIRGQEARLIIPSADQPVGTAGDSVVIIRLPKPVQACSPSCHYLVLWADVEHIWKIAKTIRFLDY